ncbi:hypothetical protein RJ639_018239 [Escallonia herrerae]|uniref:Uncharacterized protein n=1 Tax=Escallonia herrerae TaxID=1293975 RepID=A0AA88VAW1_9ASTE|nr:hypothetical protein RJ639_018239 [Escallonia herrerae]
MEQQQSPTGRAKFWVVNVKGEKVPLWRTCLCITKKHFTGRSGNCRSIAMSSSAVPGAIRSAGSFSGAKRAAGFIMML